MAVNLYFEVEVLAPSGRWEVEFGYDSTSPDDENNLVIQTALKIAPSMKPHKLRMTAQAPQTAGGLGFSACLIVAGIELACLLGGVSLSIDDKLRIACELEGHPDNVVPAILGGIVVSSYFDGKLEYVRVPSPKVTLIAVSQDVRISTKEARLVLPKQLTFAEAVTASTISNVMVSALAVGDIQTAGRMMEHDRWHEQYRSKLFPKLDEIRQLAHTYEAYATYLSGAGSTIMCMIDSDKAIDLINALQTVENVMVTELRICDCRQ
jgi:homoserine kinase